MSENENEKETEAEMTEETDTDSVPENETSAAEEAAENTEADDALSEEIESLKAQLAEEQEKYKRLDAEYYNYRQRSLKEKQEAANDAKAAAVEEILSVTDNFERALAAETSDESYKKGVDMIFRQFCDILGKLGVEEIEAMNCPFDPNVHHAVNQTEDENFGENMVCAVFQKGYKLGGKVIRPAMVSVANP